MRTIDGEYTHVGNKSTFKSRVRQAARNAGARYDYFKSSNPRTAMVVETGVMWAGVIIVTDLTIRCVYGAAKLATGK